MPPRKRRLQEVVEDSGAEEEAEDEDMLEGSFHAGPAGGHADGGDGDAFDDDEGADGHLSGAEALERREEGRGQARGAGTGRPARE